MKELQELPGHRSNNQEEKIFTTIFWLFSFRHREAHSTKPPGPTSDQGLTGLEFSSSTVHQSDSFALST